MAVELKKDAEIRPLFELLFKRVEEALQSCPEFEALIGNFKSTLHPLQSWIKGERKGLEDLVDKELLVDKIQGGIEIVGKFTNVQIWKYYWRRYDYTYQLVHLDRYYRELLDCLLKKECETCIHLVVEMDRRHFALAEKLRELGREKLSEMLKKDEDFSEALSSFIETLAQGCKLKKPKAVLTVHDRMEEECATEMYALLESAYDQCLSSVPISERQSATIFKPLLGDLKMTLHDDLVKPKSTVSKCYYSKKELERFRVEMENGAEMVQECCKVGEWASYTTKYKYIKALLELNQSLQRMRLVKFERVWKDVAQIRDIEPVVDRAERALGSFTAKGQCKQGTLQRKRTSPLQVAMRALKLVNIMLKLLILIIVRC